MDKHFKCLVIILLMGVLAALVAIYLKLPAPSPTIREIQNASETKRQRLLLQRPMILVGGSVYVDNTPLEVEIVR